MRSLIAGFALGVCLLQMQCSLPGSGAMLLLAALGLALILLLKRIRRFAWRISLLAGCGATVGFLWAAIFAQCYLADELPRELEGRDIVATGTIDSLPYRFERGQRFNFAIEHAEADGVPLTRLPQHVALSWYAHEGEDEALPVNVQPGERWRLKLKLQRPHGTANAGGFDYEVWLLEQHLRATGAVRTNAGDRENVRQDAFVWGAHNIVQSLRAGMRDRILAALPGERYAGMVVALVIGDERGVGQSDWKVVNRTGIGHLVAISGLHITLIAGMFARLVHWLWCRSFFTRAQLPLLLPASKAAALAGVSLGIVYAFLAGFGIPAQRTFYMLIVVAWAMWTGRIASITHIAALALGAVLLLDPWAVLSPGFWLSFGCVALILYVTAGRFHVLEHDPGSKRLRFLAWCKAEGRTQLALSLGLVPLTVLLFGEISVISPIANAIAIPVLSLVVTPMALIGSALPTVIGAPILQLAHGLIDLLMHLLGWMADLPAAVWAAPVPPPWIFACALLGTLWLLAPRGLPLRALGLLGWLPLLLNGASQPPDGSLWITAFDVGQGMGVLIETPHHRLLYDTGPAYSPESDGGNRVILPYLHARGIYHLDGLVISHNDNDHSGGALSIIHELPIGWTLSSLAYDSPIVQAAPRHQRCVAGQHWEWDGVTFEILQPAPSSYDSTKYKPNARSCTLKVTAGSQSMLLAGDIEAMQEEELVGAIPDKLKATVLLAPHHGSGTSSTLPFLKTVQPQVAIFQVGYRNRFHHPKAEVFERYGALGIERLRSDESGAVKLQLGDGMAIEEYRRATPHYWYGS